MVLVVACIVYCLANCCLVCIGLLQQVHQLRPGESQHCHWHGRRHWRRPAARHYIRLLRLQGGIIYLRLCKVGLFSLRVSKVGSFLFLQWQDRIIYISAFASWYYFRFWVWKMGLFHFRVCRRDYFHFYACYVGLFPLSLQGRICLTSAFSTCNYFPYGFGKCDYFKFCVFRTGFFHNWHFYCYPFEFAREDVVNFPFTRIWFFVFPLLHLCFPLHDQVFFIQLVQDWIFWSFCVCNMGFFCHRDTRVWIFHTLHSTFARLDFFAFCVCNLGRQFFSLCVLRLDFKSVWNVFAICLNVYSAFCFSRVRFRLLRHMVGIFSILGLII